MSDDEEDLHLADHLQRVGQHTLNALRLGNIADKKQGTTAPQPTEQRKSVVARRVARARLGNQHKQNDWFRRSLRPLLPSRHTTTTTF